MTVIRPNSISGITSITAQANEINVFRSNGLIAGLNLNGVNFNTTAGISTLAALKVTGNLDVEGVLTYQDVTNVDSLGIGTFRTGINVSGGQLDVGSNIKLGNAGVITATTFSGSGASLTNLNASNIASGTVPTARLGSGTASSSTFLAGDSTYKTVTGTTINTNADNRIITGSGTANTLNGESTLTYDGTFLLATSSNFVLKGIDTNASNAENYIQFNAGKLMYHSDENGAVGSSGHYFNVDGSEKLRVNSGGQLIFDADTDTYIHRPQANQLAITIAGGSFPIVRFGTGGSNSTVGFSTDTTLVTNSERISVRGFSSFKSTSNVYAAIYTHNEGNTSGTYNAHLLWNAGGANRGGIGYMPNNGEAVINNQNAINFATGATNLGGTTRLSIKSDGEVNFANDAVFTNSNSNWTGNKAGKIQHYSNILYIQGGTSGTKIRASDGSGETIFSGKKIDIEGGRASNDDAMIVQVLDTYHRKIQFAEATDAYAVGQYGGFIGYDAANNYMTLGTNGAGTAYNGITISRNGGYVLNPTQPKFSVYMANTYSWNNQFIVYDSELYDIGSNYNTSNGKFTAPVTGYYVFGVKFRANGGFSQFGGMWTRNSSTYKRAFGQNSYAQGDCITAVDVIPMSANDTMAIRFEGSHGGATGGAHENGFWGYLLG